MRHFILSSRHFYPPYFTSVIQVIESWQVDLYPSTVFLSPPRSWVHVNSITHLSSTSWQSQWQKKKKNCYRILFCWICTPCIYTPKCPFLLLFFSLFFSSKKKSSINAGGITCSWWAVEESILFFFSYFLLLFDAKRVSTYIDRDSSFFIPKI